MIRFDRECVANGGATAKSARNAYVDNDLGFCRCENARARRRRLDWTDTGYERLDVRS